MPAAVLLVPGSLLTLGTGFLLGLGWGTVAVSAGSTAGAAAAFAVGRGLLRERIRRRMTEDRRFRAVDRAVEEDGFRVTLLLRLSPLVPFSLMGAMLTPSTRELDTCPGPLRRMRRFEWETYGGQLPRTSGPLEEP